MKIKRLKPITIGDIVKGYEDKGDDGVFGYGGKLDIRPPFQREYIYESAEKIAVIDTIKKNFPLNAMYWAVCDDGKFEIIDGQQRTLSICKYVDNNFTVDGLFFHNMPSDIRKKFLNYKLHIYLCKGDDSEKLGWFETINTAGEKLENQELLNAIYHGSWVSDARRHFSKPNGGAVGYKQYLKGKPIRQHYLATVLKWVIDSENVDSIKEYMAMHAKDANAEPLWDYFVAVMDWIEKTFPTYRKKLMQGRPWGIFYNKYSKNKYDAKELENQISVLLADEDVINKNGVYEFVLGGCQDRRLLDLRTFSSKDKITLYERQKGVCAICKKQVKMEECEIDHIKPWHLNHDGTAGTNLENGHMTCKKCNREKGGKISWG